MIVGQPAAAATRYPLFLDLAGRRVVVVGGGPVAARRAAGLAQAGSRVLVIAPWVCEDVADILLPGQVDWLAREFQPSDLDVDSSDPIWLVHTATGDPEVDAQVAALAHANRIWAVRADSAADSSAWVPAVARDDSGLTVAVSAAADPGRATAVRDAVAAELADGSLGLRRSRARRTPGQAAQTGWVALVGGGPGDPGLITVRGRRLLAQADVIITDRLGPTALLDELAQARDAGEVQVINVGKLPGNHPVPQDEINRLLVEHAQRGSNVVRLKGGDPFVLGRGGEEALHCARHGIAVQVVPGVTAAVAVPAAAGIPVTHRGITTSFVVASAHAGGQAATVAAHAAAPDATLVLLMGVATLRQTTSQLMAAGRPAATPVAIIAEGWLPGQQVVIGTLADIAGKSAIASLAGRPCVIVVGEVVGVGTQLAQLLGAAP